MAKPFSRAQNPRAAPRPVARRHVADQSDPVRAAAAYEQQMRAAFALGPRDVPRFDAIVLRPGALVELPDETGRLAVVTWSPARRRRYVTLTPAVIHNAELVLGG